MKYEDISKVSGLGHNEINNNKHSLRSNTKCYGGKTHNTDSQNSDTTASSGRELYHLQFSLQAASPETSEYTLVHHVKSTYTVSLPPVASISPTHPACVPV
jgi:hypothetical protein